MKEKLPKGYMTAEDVCKRLNITMEALAYLVSIGKLPAFKQTENGPEKVSTEHIKIIKH